ncbi:MAG: ATP-binding protein [Candidatus Nanopelagicales bacterium]|nr:ATP-binding protein [Candidatus Nanopelagicales bacterium]
MPQIRLTAGDPLVARLAHESNPVKAVIELIWNSFDADADQVAVELDRNDAGGIEGVTIIDDGHGIPAEAIEATFREVGESWKRGATQTHGKGRPLHGKMGEGRLRALALGERFDWNTTAVCTDGVTRWVLVSGTVDSRSDWWYSEPTETHAATGTTFRATGRQGLDRLESAATVQQLVATFAPYLIAQPSIELTYDGTKLDPLEHRSRDKDVPITWTFEGTSHSALLTIIEWDSGSERSLHLCNSAGVSLLEGQKPPAADFPYTAYVRWDGFDDDAHSWVIADMDPDASAIGGLRQTVMRELRDYIDSREAEDRRGLVQVWIDNGTFPYSGAPENQEQQLERSAFELVATKMRRFIPTQKPAQKLTLGLLKSQFQANPGDLAELLQHWAGLNDTDRDDLDRLLRTTGFSGVIRASSNVTKRIAFLAALEQMIFDPDIAPEVGETAHLHRIVEKELWLFGEQFNMMLSERGLTAVLEQHRRLLGENVIVGDVVRRLDGRTGRMDLVLSGTAREPGRHRHLVVELKAPDVNGGLTELAQIKSYARTVTHDPRFSSTTTIWDFVLIVREMDPEVIVEVNQARREPGLAFESDDAGHSVRVWVRRWSDIIAEAREKLDYIQSHLKYDPSVADAREYLNLHHAEFLPDALRGTIVDVERPDESP